VCEGGRERGRGTEKVTFMRVVWVRYERRCFIQERRVKSVQEGRGNRREGEGEGTHRPRGPRPGLALWLGSVAASRWPRPCACSYRSPGRGREKTRGKPQKVRMGDKSVLIKATTRTSLPLSLPSLHHFRPPLHATSLVRKFGM